MALFKNKLFKLVIATVLLFAMVLPLASCDIILEILGVYDDSYEEESYEIPEGTAEFHFIDIDQGDAILILVDGKAILIDTGEGKEKEALDAYLENLGITELEYFITTHPDSDHIGSAAHVVENYKINHIILSPKEHTTKTYEKFITAIENKVDNGEILEENVMIAEGDLLGESLYVGELEMRILGPVDPSAFKRNDNNNPSVVIMARWGNNKVLLTGDAEKEAELQLIGEYGSYLKCDVLKVGHHGSSSSTHREDPANGIMYGFLYYVEPKIGVISCGVDNDYGHPHKETLDELEEFDVEILRTDLLGSIVLTSDGTNITQKTN